MSHHFRDSRAFTLVEFLVSIGIVFAILSVILLNQSAYTDSVALTNAADELGLTVSQAQAYSIGVRELSPGSSNFSSAYGVSFSINAPDSDKSYIYFADRNTSEHYDGSWLCPNESGSECLERIEIPRGNYINSFCVIRTQGSDQCGTVHRADITFLRPDTDAKMKFFNSGGQQYQSPNIKGVRVILKSPGGATRSVAIYLTGQVSVESSYTPPDDTWWALTVSKSGTGTGTVTGNDINCGSTCSSILAEGTVTSLTATPSGTDTFTGWSGDCAGTGTCVTNMNADKSVTATFTHPVCSSGSQTFTYTGANQAFTVPPNCTSITIKAWGAGGGGTTGGASGPGGGGGYSTGTLIVTPGQQLTIIAGGGGKGQNSGAMATNAYGGGGAGHQSSDWKRGAAGGGRSAVRDNSGAEVITAGGGGGGGDDVPSPSSGGRGGGSVGGCGGEQAYTGTCTSNDAQYGKGGTQSVGGGGGVAAPWNGVDYCFNWPIETAGAGSAYTGGNSAALGGTGGGSGYYGGGGGAWNGAWCYTAHAGGGSGYAGGVTGGSTTIATGPTPPNTSDPSYIAGVGVGSAAASGANGGNGLVVISW